MTWRGPAPKGKIVTTGWDPMTMTPPMSWNSSTDGGKIDGRAAHDVLHGHGHVIEDEL